MELKRIYGTFGKVTDIARKENEKNNFAKCGSDANGFFFVDVDDTDNVIFTKLAKVAKVVFPLLHVQPGTYTAKGLAADCANKEYDRQEEKRKYAERAPMKKAGKNSQTCGGVKESIYTYDWETLDNCLTSAEDGKIRITLGSYSCTFAPLTVFFLLDKFSKLATLSSAEKKELTTFIREEEEELTEVYSFAMPCDGKKILPFLAKDDLRPQLKGAYIDVTGYLVGTECFSLVAAPINITCKEKAELKSVICHPDVIKEAKKGDIITVYKRQGENFKKGEGNYITECGKVKRSTLLGNFPNWRSIFRDSAHVATFSKKEFTDLKKQAKSLKKIGGAKFFQLLLSNNGKAVIKAENVDYNEQKSIDISAYVIRDAHTFMGYERMESLFLEGTQIEMYCQDPHKAIVFRTYEGFHFVVMPFHCYNVEVSESCYHTDDLEDIKPLDRPVTYDDEACTGEACSSEERVEEHVASSASEEREEEVGKEELKAEGEERVEDVGREHCGGIASDRHCGAIASNRHGSPIASYRCGRVIRSPMASEKSPTASENTPTLTTVHLCTENGTESANKGPPQSFCVTYIYKQ